MTAAPHQTLQAIAESAAAATGAAHAWLLAVEGEELRVVAASGPDAGADLGRSLSAGEGAAAYVAASGQPLALRPRPGDAAPWSKDHPLLHQVPTGILSVPCEVRGVVVGVLELVDKAGGEPFSFDDLELATLLSTVAGAALSEGGGRVLDVRDPADLARGLAQLAREDADHYARVAMAVDALLAHG